MTTTHGTAWVERVALTDDHRSVLATLLRSYEQARSTEGTVVVMFHRAHLLEKLHKSDAQPNYVWLKRVLDDLAGALLKLETDEAIMTSKIVRRHAVSKKKDARGPLYAVEFEKEYVHLVEDDLPIFVPENRLRRILALKKDLVRSVAWYVTSHDENTMTIEQIFEEIGVPKSLSKRTLRDYRAQLVAETNGLLDLGIALTTTENGKPRVDWHGDPE